MKRSPRAAISPPKTAVNRVDFRRHQATITGDSNDATHNDRAASAPKKKKEKKKFEGKVYWGYGITLRVFIILADMSHCSDNSTCD